MPPPSRRRSSSRIGLADQLRTAIEACGRSDYELALEAELAPSVVSRFVAGVRGLTLDSMDRLCEVLELHLVAIGGWRSARAARGRAETPRRRTRTVEAAGASEGPPAPREDADGPGVTQLKDS